MVVKSFMTRFEAKKWRACCCSKLHQTILLKDSSQQTNTPRRLSRSQLAGIYCSVVTFNSCLFQDNRGRESRNRSTPAHYIHIHTHTHMGTHTHTYIYKYIYVYPRRHKTFCFIRIYIIYIYTKYKYK